MAVLIWLRVDNGVILGSVRCTLGSVWNRYRARMRSNQRQYVSRHDPGPGTYIPTPHTNMKIRKAATRLAQFWRSQIFDFNILIFVCGVGMYVPGPGSCRPTNCLWVDRMRARYRFHTDPTVHRTGPLCFRNDPTLTPPRDPYDATLIPI